MKDQVDFTVFKDGTSEDDCLDLVAQMISAYQYSIDMDHEPCNMDKVDFFKNDDLNEIAIHANNMLAAANEGKEFKPEVIDELVAKLANMINSFSKENNNLFPELNIIHEIAHGDNELWMELLADWQKICGDTYDSNNILCGYAVLISFYNNPEDIEVWQELKSNNMDTQTAISKYLIYLYRPIEDFEKRTKKELH